MERAVWIILNNNFSLTLDSEIKDGKVVDKRFSPGNDLWTTEIPQLRFSDENIQNDYNDFVFDIVALFASMVLPCIALACKPLTTIVFASIRLALILPP